MDELCKTKSYRNILDIIQSLNDKITTNDQISDNGSKPFMTPIKNKMSKDSLILKKHTHFSSFEISILSKLFYTLKSENKSSLLLDSDFKQFLQITLDITDSLALNGIIHSAKQNSLRKGVKLHEFIITLNILLRGTIEEKSYLSFQILDYDHDGYIRKNQEIINLIRNTINKYIAATNVELDPGEPERDINEYIWKKFDSSSSLTIDYQCFREAILKEPLLLESMNKFLPSDLRSAALQTLLFSKSKL